jgi:nucleotide-binding universal stress UspA family protein
MYRSLLVPLDGSKFGEQALPYAAHLARRSEAHLHLVNVFSPVGGSMFVEGYLFPNDEVDRYLRKRQTDYLHRTAARLREITHAPVTVHAPEGVVVEELHRLAIETAADLIVLTTHGRNPLGRFWLGSVADDLLRDAPAPLLVVRPVAEENIDYKTDPLPRHLLIPLDGSREAEEALEPAIALGALVGADYTLLQILKPLMPLAYHLGAGSVEQVATTLIDQIEAAHAALRKQAEAYLEKTAAALRARSLTVTTKIAVEDQPGTAIIQNAMPPIDGLAIRTHARHGLSRLFFGSVTDKVVRSLHLPILVQPPKKK